MQTKEYRTVDKSEWPRGDWDDEPDKMQWADPETLMPCLIVRNLSGALCGYVGVTESHPLFGKNYDDAKTIDDDYIDVHGGLTFASACANTTDESRYICHVPDPGEPAHVWWFGFDCAHAGDASPQDYKYAEERGYPFTVGPDERYRTMRYVRHEVAKLARQLAAHFPR